jgi:hypothetical protein
MKPSVGLLTVLLAAIVGLPAVATAEETSCITCHGDADLFEADQVAAVTEFGGDVHAEVGLSCHDCHGGNPAAELADDPDAMDPDWATGPYVGKPERQEIPGFCGRCHSDPVYMKRFKPDIRVDQEQEYWTSHHGKGLLEGDTNVATCTDCHGIHGIQRANSPDSTVYPTKVGETCNGCHGNPEKMDGYELAGGLPMPIDQFERWKRSVHAQAMFEREDLTAPTCNDCHGNHGATPPGLEAVTFVCGQCHGREAEIYRASPKHDGFELHNELLQEAGSEGCAACHESPQAEVTEVQSFGECTTCHSNHGIVRPTLAMFAALPSAPCAFCHEGSTSLAGNVVEPLKNRENYDATLARLQAEADTQGLTEDDRFNWFVEQAEILPEHSIAPELSDAASRRLRPEFANLFSKFRIGKTFYTYRDPVSGEEVKADIIRCGSCHESVDLDADSGAGARTGVEFVERMRELTALTGRAERILLAAHRGGVETREAVLDVDQAVDAQISLEVLLHTFSTDEDGAFMEQHAAGLEHAQTALTKGQEALDELTFRRKGLAVALIFIVVVLIALGLKIRELSARTAP